jgi:hypothetical protein
VEFLVFYESTFQDFEGSMFQSYEEQSFEVSKIRYFWVLSLGLRTKVLRFLGIMVLGFQGFKNARFWFEEIKFLRFQSFRVFKFLGIKILRFWELSRYQEFRFQKFRILLF